ncbi:uncharacterized protein LOC122820323 [Gambusia affinis]|uniref:uncharacterized protein LOC122820323 n=1 Tax=Gambusia affinis TaxID=33528 RepID=UPI001CDCB242|nr:uncharacterized protein LOC122820323 [Gambusia affinis]
MCGTVSSWKPLVPLLSFYFSTHFSSSSFIPFLLFFSTVPIRDKVSPWKSVRGLSGLCVKQPGSDSRSASASRADNRHTDGPIRADLERKDRAYVRVRLLSVASLSFINFLTSRFTLSKTGSLCFSSASFSSGHRTNSTWLTRERARACERRVLVSCCSRASSGGGMDARSLNNDDEGMKEKEEQVKGGVQVRERKKKVKQRRKRDKKESRRVIICLSGLIMIKPKLDSEKDRER